MLYRVADELFERGEVDVGEALDVEAAHSDTMLAEFFKQLLVPLAAGHDVDGQVLFARRKAGLEPVAFAAAGTSAEVCSEANDAAGPKLGLGLGDLPHDGQELQAVVALLIIGNSAEEPLDAFFGGFGFERDHIILATTGRDFELRITAAV